MAVTREDLIEQSVTDFVRAGLTSRGYTDGRVAVREAFPSPDERAGELTITTVAIGFNFDDGGRYIEMGSDLTERIYTIEFWTFGTSRTYGRNVANVIRSICEEGPIPLKDVTQEDAPQIDTLLVLRAAVTRQIARDPRPWDENVYTTTVKVEDVYSPSLVD